MNKETLLEKLSIMLFKIPAIQYYWDKKFKALEYTNIPWTKLKKSIKEYKIVLITTGGIHLKSDKKFDLIDCQFVNEHLLSLGAKVIDSDKFKLSDSNPFDFVLPAITNLNSELEKLSDIMSIIVLIFLL